MRGSNCSKQRGSKSINWKNYGGKSCKGIQNSYKESQPLKKKNKKTRRESQPLNIQAKGLLQQQENARPIFFFLKIINQEITLMLLL